MVTTEELMGMADDQKLRCFDSWLVVVARALQPRGDNQDVVQEGRIAMWRSLGTYDGGGALPSWMTRCAKARMIDVAVHGKSPTGREPLRNHHELLRHADRVSLEGLVDDGDVELEDPRMASVVEQVQDAAAYADVRRAVAGLTDAQRDFVVLKFWGGVYDSPRRRDMEVSRDLVPEYADKRRRFELWDLARETLRVELETLS